MRYRRKEPETVKERYVSAGVQCDICKDTSIDGFWDDDDGNMHEIEIEAKLGFIWPEGDFRDGYRLDVCPKCFLNKVKPALEALGAKFTEYSVDEHCISREVSESYQNLADGRKWIGEKR